MNHSEILKKLKKISPDESYTMRSKSVILSTIPDEPQATVWQMLMHSVQFGSAVALTGLLFVLIFGAWSTWRVLSPFKLASLDVSDLRAEAEAVDVQLQLADLHYTEPAVPTTTQATAAASTGTPTIAKTQAESQAETMGLVPSSSSAPETVSIDQALDSLSQ